MSKQFEVGKQYRLVDASKSPAALEAITKKWVTIPVGLVWECHAVSDGDAETHSAGIKGQFPNPNTGDIVVALQGSLDSGAYEEVADHGVLSVEL